MQNMRLLSFLLTADLTKAEECFVSGLQDCIQGSRAFQDWARSWARRTIIQNAIRRVGPRPSESASRVVCSEEASCNFGRSPEDHASITSILGLEDFERFVFVMSILEKYPDQECSVLLGCSRQGVHEARLRALLHIAGSDRLRTVAPSGCGSSGPQKAQTQEAQ